MRDLYNCGFPSYHVVPDFATTMSNLWNMLLTVADTRSGGGRGQVLDHFRVVSICEHVADNILPLGPHL